MKDEDFEINKKKYAYAEKILHEKHEKYLKILQPYILRVKTPLAKNKHVVGLLKKDFQQVLDGEITVIFGVQTKKSLRDYEFYILSRSDINSDTMSGHYHDFQYIIYTNLRTMKEFENNAKISDWVK